MTFDTDPMVEHPDIATEAIDGPDPELVAIAAVVRALADLDDEVQRRILRWALDRYEVNQ